MGRIVERLILTKDNRVRDRGTLNRFYVGAPTWPSVLSPMGLADCIQLGPHFGPDALPKTYSLSTIKHYFTTLHSLTSEDCATLPKATKVRRIVTGQASGLTMQPTAGARQDDQSHRNSNRHCPNQGCSGHWQAWSIRSGSENRHLQRSQVASPATDPGLPD